LSRDRLSAELKIDPFFIQLQALLVCKNNILTARALLAPNVLNGFDNSINTEILGNGDGSIFIVKTIGTKHKLSLMVYEYKKAHRFYIRQLGLIFSRVLLNIVPSKPFF